MSLGFKNTMYNVNKAPSFKLFYIVHSFDREFMYLNIIYYLYISLFKIIIPPPQNVGGLYWIRFVASVGRSVCLQFWSAL